MYSPYAWISSQTLSAVFTSISLSSASTSFLYVACLYTAFFHAVRTLWFLVTASIPGACWMSVIWSRSTFSRLATCSHLGKKRDTSLMWSSDIISSNCWSVTAYFNARADIVSIPLSAELYWGENSTTCWGPLCLNCSQCHTHSCPSLPPLPPPCTNVNRGNLCPQ